MRFFSAVQSLGKFVYISSSKLYLYALLTRTIVSCDNTAPGLWDSFVWRLSCSFIENLLWNCADSDWHSGDCRPPNSHWPTQQCLMLAGGRGGQLSTIPIHTTSFPHNKLHCDTSQGFLGFIIEDQSVLFSTALRRLVWSFCKQISSDWQVRPSRVSKQKSSEFGFSCRNWDLLIISLMSNNSGVCWDEN